MKPKAGYAVGDIIPSTASIYFDSNPVIVTNTFNTEFVANLGNSIFDDTKISLSPNPANETVTITNFNSNTISSIKITDATGKRVYELKNNTLNSINIDVSRYANGLYLIEMISENNIKTTKKLILN